MKQFEIINPSDACTIEAADPTIAAVAIMAVGNGQLGLADEDDNCVMPILAFGGFHRWLVDVGIAEEGADEDAAGKSLAAYVEKHKPAIADALDTCMYGTFADRRAYNRGLEMIASESGREKWRKDWAEDRRTSMNQICTACWATAKILRDSLADEEGAGDAGQKTD